MQSIPSFTMCWGTFLGPVSPAPGTLLVSRRHFTAAHIAKDFQCEGRGQTAAAVKVQANVKNRKGTKTCCSFCQSHGSRAAKEEGVAPSEPLTDRQMIQPRRRAAPVRFAALPAAGLRRKAGRTTRSCQGASCPRRLRAACKRRSRQQLSACTTV